MSRSNPQRVLVVEDEYFLADDLKKALELEGIIVIGPVASVDDALTLLSDAAIDCAILDINLDGQMVYPLAATLRARDVPFMFVTGYDELPQQTDWNDVALIQKPFARKALLDGIARLVDHRAGGA